jgi:hypothetical protein
MATARRQFFLKFLKASVADLEVDELTREKVIGQQITKLGRKY